MPSMYELTETDGNKQYLINKQPIDEDKVPTNTKNVLNTQNIVDEFGTIIVDNKKEEGNDAKPSDPTSPGDDGDMVAAPNQPPQPSPDPAAPAGPATPPTAPEVPETPAAKSGEEDTADADDPESPADEIAAAANPEKPSDKGADQDPLLDDDEATDLDLDDGADDILADGDDELPDDPEDDNRDKAAPKADVDNPPAEKKAENPEKAAKKNPVPSRSRHTVAKSVETPKFKSKVPQSNPGMGFPRNNGKTSDIFDINVPHTQTKLVGGWAVPLSAESYQTRSEGEIMAKLIELGFEITDYNEIERKQNHSDAVGGNGLLMEDDEVDEDISLG